MSTTGTFSSRLSEGLIGEGVIAKWLIGRGYNVLPAYQVEVNSGKGPRVFTAAGQFVSPDMLCFNNTRTIWCEAKTKSAFTWHRNSGTWQTGIDMRHWEHYKVIAKISPWPVWLLFLHKPGSQAKDTPEGKESPTGLYGNSVTVLRDCIHHDSDRYGPSGMVYWCVDSLRLIAEYSEVNYSTATSVNAA